MDGTGWVFLTLWQGLPFGTHPPAPYPGPQPPPLRGSRTMVPLPAPPGAVRGGRRAGGRGVRPARCTRNSTACKIQGCNGTGYRPWAVALANLRIIAVVLALALSAAGCGLDAGPSGQPTADVPATATARPPQAPTATAGPAATATPVPRRRQTVSLAGLAQPVAVPPLPAAFALPTPDQRLQELITKSLEGVEGNYSVVVHHLADGRYAGLNPHYAHHTASLFKLAVLAAAFRERDAGRLDFQRLLTIDDWYVEFDLGTLARLGLEPEDRVTVRDAIAAMIVISDTSLALLVQDAAGAARVKALVDAEGLTNTSLPLPPLRSTARDMAHLLEVIASGAGFTEASRQEMLALLLQESIRAGIAAGIPEGTALAHKTGNLEDATHDVGIVWGPTGPYLLAVLSDQPWQWEPVVRVSQAVYQYFAAPAGTAPPETAP